MSDFSTSHYFPSLHPRLCGSHSWGGERMGSPPLGRGFCLHFLDSGHPPKVFGALLHRKYVYSLTCISIAEWMATWVTIQDFISQTVLSVVTGSSLPPCSSHTPSSLYHPAPPFLFWNIFFFLATKRSRSIGQIFFFSAPSSNLTQWM